VTPPAMHEQTLGEQGQELYGRVGLSQLLSRARATFAAPSNADDGFCLALDTEILISLLLAGD